MSNEEYCPDNIAERSCYKLGYAAGLQEGGGAKGKKEHRCPGFACPRCAPDAAEREMREMIAKNQALEAEIKKRDEKIKVLINCLSQSGFSCADCVFTEKCKFAWDVYNTDGDCLAQK
jgi:hypothetical protein